MSTTSKRKAQNQYPDIYTLKNCEDEPIHRPESIQSYGYLIAFDRGTGRIGATSDNIDKLLKLDNLLGTDNSGYQQLVSEGIHFNELLQSVKSQETTADAIVLANNNDSRVPLTVTFNSEKVKLDNNHHHDAVLYLSGDWVVVEIEEYSDDATVVIEKQSRLHMSQSVIDLKSHDSLPSLAEAMTSHIKRMTHYDRVMMYKFDEDYNGEVIAESKEKQLEPFLGLHYPASDIPAQARRLYEKNWIRMIADVDEQQVNIVPSVTQSEREPLDMSYSMLRSVSQFHIEYLKNMGVQATMSISLLKEGKLWGLIACHHYSPKYIPQNIRLECETLGQFFSWQIQTKEQSLALAASSRSSELIDKIIFSFTDNLQAIPSLQGLREPILNLMNATGFVLYLGHEVYEVGTVPNQSTVKDIASAFNKDNRGSVHASNNLSKDFREVSLETGEDIAGALYVPLSPRHNYFAIWFRDERVKTVKWGGAPQTKSSDEENRLSPRGSFALWREVVRGTCEDWTLADIKTAERFSRLFIAHVIERKINAESNLAEMQHLDRAKDQFLANVSHELRTPLNIIVGWTDLALTSQDNYEQMLEAIKIIRRSALTQSELINDLLDISRIVSGTMKLSVKNINLENIITDVHESFSTASAAKGIKVIKTISNDDQTILGDPTRVKQIILNLVSNAIKFTDKNGKISISARKEHSSYIVEVKDNGRGLSEESIPLIFQRFSQVEHRHGKIGMGLGLSIVKHLVDMHGGNIEVESDGLGKGSTFRVIFPVSPVSVSDEGESVYFTNEKGPIELNKEKGRLQGLRVIVAEDDTDASMFIDRILKTQGAIVSTACNGVEALDMMEHTDEPFDLVLSDIGMPEMDGYELIAEIRRRQGDKYDNVCGIALTAYALSTDRVKALKAGFNSYVTKPVDLEELLTVIETTCDI